jgi:hypothetical protein
MSLSIRRIPLRVALAGALLTISAVGVAAGTATAGTSARPHTAPPPVDHQLCYNASGTQWKIPPGIRLINQFSPNGFIPVIKPAVVVHCNPVQKTVAGHVYPITNPNAHLACFPLSVPSIQPTPTVQVANQFGTAILVPSQPNLLCVPSWKSLTGPPGRRPTTPPGLNHFTCYPVKVKAGAYKPPPVLLKDEFSSKPVSARVNPVPAELCLPTEKILPTGQVFPIINPTLHLLCFPVTQTPRVPKVWDENQFGTSPIAVGPTKWLCPPSTKTIVG